MPHSVAGSQLLLFYSPLGKETAEISMSRFSGTSDWPLSIIVLFCVKKNGTLRSAYENGQRSAEARFSKGKLDGLARYWHENGVLAFEIPLKAGLRHGLCKQWNEGGHLLGSFKMTMGTGVVRHWYSNGQLHYEMDTLRGIPNGRQRLWTETGTVLVEKFYVNGKGVSFSRYSAACKRNPDLAVYSAVSIPRIMRSRRGVTVPRCVLPDDDGSVFWRS
jgi:hypothetical protein